MCSNHKISFRITDVEYKHLLESASAANVSLSQYIRFLISNPSNTLGDNNKTQNAITKLCILQTVLVEEGLDNNEPLMTAVNNLWHTLY